MSRFRFESRDRNGIRALTGIVAVGALVAIAGASCGESSATIAQRTLTGTVSLSNERVLLVDAVVEVVVEGNPRLDEIHYTLEAAITATSAEVAEQIASRIAIGVERPMGAIRIVVAPPSMGTITGRLRIFAPPDLDVGVVERASNVTVGLMEGDIQVDSLASVLIIDPKRTVSVGIQSGNGLIETNLPIGELTEVLVQNGDIQLTIPSGRVSAAIEATAGPNGAVVISHPSLPQPLPGRPYGATVNGGLSTVRLVTRNGSVIIRTP